MLGFDFESFAFTLQHALLINTCFTIFTIVIYKLFKHIIALGFTAITTWSFKEQEKLHEEHGMTFVILSTFYFGFFIAHILSVIALWVSIIFLT